MITPDSPAPCRLFGNVSKESDGTFVLEAKEVVIGAFPTTVFSSELGNANVHTSTVIVSLIKRPHLLGFSFSVC